MGRRQAGVGTLVPRTLTSTDKALLKDNTTFSLQYLNSSTTPIEMTKLNHMDEIRGRVPTFVRRLIV